MSPKINEMIDYIVYEVCHHTHINCEMECTLNETCRDCYKIYLTGVLNL